MVDWPTPSNRIDLKGFLGLVGFYRNFIKSFSKISAMLIELLNGNAEIKRTPACEDNFYKLRKAFTHAHVLQPTNQITQQKSHTHCASLLLYKYELKAWLSPPNHKHGGALLYCFFIIFLTKSKNQNGFLQPTLMYPPCSPSCMFCCV